MSNLYHDIRVRLDSAIAELALPGELNMQAITVEPPKDPSHGDVSTNAAMVLAKAAGMNPRALAEQIIDKLKGWEQVEEVSIAGPGFINLRLSADFWRGAIPAIARAGTGYGDSDMGAGHRVNVEYVSANPTGPLHVGHARGAIYGDALAQLLVKTGYDVTREYYINDAGAQVDVLARSAYLRYREACGEVIDIPEGLYPGDYLKAAGEAIKASHGEALLNESDEKWLPAVKQIAIDSMMDLIRDDLAALGVHQEVFTSEQSLHDAGAIEKAIAVLRDKGLIYRGVLEPPKGKLPDDWEAREQVLFKSTQYGDDVDRALQKPDDSYTYFAADLAYAQHKIDRGFDRLVYMFGADHGGYKKRIEAAVSALSDKQVQADIKLCQLVHLMKGGEPVKMSKRAGNFETVRDVVDAVGKDILRFIMLTRKSDMVMEFDLEKVKEQSKDNPVFYVQYAHARAKSVLRLASEESAQALTKSTDADLSRLSHAQEMTVIKTLAAFPRAVEQAAAAHEPHRIAYFLQELAAEFHGLWHVGSKDADLRFVTAGNIELTAARLALAQAVATVIASGLEILGVTPAEEL